MKVILFALLIGLTACVHQSSKSSSAPPRKTHNFEVGPWVNPYRGDPKLAGVIVTQFTDNPYVNWQYEGKHPAMVEFYFWDGRVRQHDYEPDGTLRSEFWWPDSLKPSDGWWSDVDFSQGSDPTFKRHQDPRLRKTSKP